MYILGIDFGSKYIKTALCVKDLETNEINVLKLFKITHKASKYGTITDLVKAKEAFGQVLEKMKSEISEPIEFYVISISGENVSSYSGTSTIPLWKPENEDRRIKITGSHVCDVLKAAKMTAYNKDDKVELHSISQDFQIDDQPPTQNPIDMAGVKLKSTVYVIQTEKSHKENIGSILEAFSIENYKIVYSPLATAETVIDEEDKEAGVIVISIGDQTTELVVYLNGVLRMAKVIPFGSNNITKDLKILLQTDFSTANQIKKTKATAYSKDADPLKIIQIANSSLQKKEVSEQFVAKITEARLKEIYEFVTKEIYKGAYQKTIHSPIIITGPGSKLKGAEKLFSEINNSKTIHGTVLGIKSNADEITEDYFTAVGLVKYAIMNELFSEGDNEDRKKSIFERFKQFITDLI
ncbi:MAG: cell division protein FtsA [Candidatus Delongbacteria bacterium]|nr:cell division protein FtsA [Candidatus Delongbacteria bacterium]MCG2760882.1 cell division protein FtsA [Candidatus Delongbacteria bacterium]